MNKKWASLTGKNRRKALKDFEDEARREHEREIEAMAEHEDESKRETGAMAVFVKKGPRIHVGKPSQDLWLKTKIHRSRFILHENNQNDL